MAEAADGAAAAAVAPAFVLPARSSTAGFTEEGECVTGTAVAVAVIAVVAS